MTKKCGVGTGRLQGEGQRTAYYNIEGVKGLTVPVGSKIDCIYSYSEDGELLCECDGDVCDGTCKIHEPPMVGDKEDE